MAECKWNPSKHKGQDCPTHDTDGNEIKGKMNKDGTFTTSYGEKRPVNDAGEVIDEVFDGDYEEEFKSENETIDKGMRDLDEEDLSENELNNNHQSHSFSKKDILTLFNDIRSSGTEKERSKIYRDFFINNGYSLISYPNEIEDEGSESFIILDKNDIDEIELIDNEIGKEEPGYVYHASENPMLEDLFNNGELDMNNSSEIGIHTGSLDAAKWFNRPYIYKIKLKDNLTTYKSNKDYISNWSLLDFAKDLLNEDEEED